MRNPILMKCALPALVGGSQLLPLAKAEHANNQPTPYRAEALQSIAASTAEEHSIIGLPMTLDVEDKFEEEKSYE
jgi:hypothetical protein